MGLAGGLAANGMVSGGGGGVASSVVAWAQREQARLNAIGLQGQTFDIFSLASAATALGTQAVFGTLAGLLAGDVVANIWVDVNTLGAGTAPTGIFLGLYSTAGTLLASTANLAASAIWTATAGPVACALSAPFTVTATGGYYFAIVENGAFGTTAMQILKGNPAASAIAHALSGGVAPAVTQAAQTTLPANATFAVSATEIWFGWN